MKNILEWLEQTTRSMPDKNKTAFSGENGSLSFGDLYQSSRAVGSFIISKSIKKKPIAVFMEKSAFAVSAFLGVTYSGNFYVPLDPGMPAFRIKMILDAINPPLIICDEKTKELISNVRSVVYSSISGTEINEAKLSEVREKSIDSDPLYVVFTSGSTGEPKGVTATHRNVIDYISNLNKVLEVDANSVFGLQSPFYLDACLKEIFGTIAQGGTTVIIPKPLFMFPVKLLEFLAEKEINTICWVASALSFVAAVGALEKPELPKLRTVAFGGELIRNEHLNAWISAFSVTRFVHLYGPTEATGMSTYHVVENQLLPDERLPIGKPFGNTDIVLLDDGEICIRGAKLSPGYYNDLAKTDEAFIQNPNSDFPDRLYKTGDIGFYGGDGLLYFSTRRDFQIKHLGHRIEMSEIELAAEKVRGVKLTACVYDDEKSRIILYYVGYEVNILAELKKTLPRYMLPYRIFRLESLPTTPGGKIDRKELIRSYREDRRDVPNT